MTQKRLICPQRLRQVPRQFSWVDHLLVRDSHIDRCSHPAAALYLFLITVADAQGLSYYADTTLMRRLTMDSQTFRQARRQLIDIDLIAYQRPLYQVLALQRRAPVGDPVPATGRRQRSPGQLQALGQIFKQIGDKTP